MPIDDLITLAYPHVDKDDMSRPLTTSLRWNGNEVPCGSWQSVHESGSMPYE
jgi:hypothetical protein